MALIKCPDCGKEISDKAEKCIYCGKVFIQKAKIYCAECGAKIPDGANCCQVCGCPVGSENQTDSEPQKVEVTGIKITRKIRKFIVTGAALLLIVVLALLIGTNMQKSKVASNAKKQGEEYQTNIEKAALLILTGAGEAESCGNLIKQVWYNAIYQERDEETDEYTMHNGLFVSDFNDALTALMSDASFSIRLRNIETNQKDLGTLMKELKNPPQEYKDAYSSLSKTYDAYLTFTNLVINPNGSLQTFSSNFNDADNETVNCYNALKIYLDE